LDLAGAAAAFLNSGANVGAITSKTDAPKMQGCQDWDPSPREGTEIGIESTWLTAKSVIPFDRIGVES
jgi:hypothetical protein